MNLMPHGCRWLLAWLWVLCALPLPAAALGWAEARHLLARTGFGGGPDEVAALLPLSREQAVRQLLDGIRTQAVTPPPGWVDEPLQSWRSLGEAERKALQQQRQARARELKAWWWTELLQTPSPLTERLTLFWHNHFTSSLQKVKAPQLMYRQNVLLRAHAAGNFAQLLHAIAQDAAMILYLDGQTNRRDAPNENFARELLELFTLGEGHYSERDIREAARAFTGTTVQWASGTYRFQPSQHDPGEKTFLGHSGPFRGEDILDILLQQPRTAEHIVEKLWREFISDTPDARTVKQLAAGFRNSGYELKPLLFNLFLQPAFWDARTRGTLIKSPVELLAGTVRMLDIPIHEPQWLVHVARALGQDVFNPPNVKGWPGGKDWITAHTLLRRQQFLEQVTRGQEMGMADGQGRAMMRQVNTTAGDPLARFIAAAGAIGAKRLQALVLAVPPTQAPPAGASMREQLEHWLLDPAYQLK